MKSAEITDALIAELQKGELRHARLNYANGDMVGHTGNRDAAIIAMEALDLCLGRVIPVIKKLEGALLVTADHGNADEMFEYDKQGAIAVDKQGKRKAKTSHTLNRVPLYVYAPSVNIRIDPNVKGARLANIAATTLQLMGYSAPSGFEPGLILPA
jgi:2,3-bisphosphoglycerate-independent phosphoglycerate mutase